MNMPVVYERREGSSLRMRVLIEAFAVPVLSATMAIGQMAGMAHHADHAENSAPPPVVTTSSTVTFTKDVAPIVQRRCQECHRPGEGAPFSLLTYEDAKPWARLMKQMVEQRQMPPWFEDGHTEKF